MTTEPDIARSYDEVHYPGLCHAETHPARIAAAALLLGMEPPAPDRCRVLELGCAGGTNLVSMSLCLPGSSFVGLDLSPGQIESARRLAAAVGVTNVEFTTMDLLDVTADLGQFDYVVAHGVYSWVPDAVKDKVLAICHDHLAPNGLAFVSYNTMPGWSLPAAMRKLMQYGTRTIDRPRDRARAARRLATRLHELTPAEDDSGFAAFLDRFVNDRLLRFDRHESWDDATLLHDELAEFNDPVWFHELVDHAGRHGLRHVADATFPRSSTGDLAAEAIEQLDELSTDPVEREQYVDVLVHRSFRRSLLCHADVDVGPATADAMRRLHFAAHARLDGATGASQQPLTVAALAHLTAVSPQPVAFADLAIEASREIETAQADEVAVDQLAADLFAIASAQTEPLLDALAAAQELTPTVSARPLASALAREQARHSPYVSTLFHSHVELSGLERAIVPMLDGEHTPEEIVTALLSRLQSRSDPPPAELADGLAGDVAMALRLIGRRGLLLA